MPLKILVTGNLGFVGTETCKLLEEAKHVIRGYDLMQNKDVKDAEQLEGVIQEFAPQRILHLAAIARFAEADKNPMLAFETNVLGTGNVARLANQYHIPVVYASTGSVIMPLDAYEPPYDESIPARGNSIYGSTKAVGEYYVQKHTTHIILRYSHLYGKEKRHHGLVGGFIERIERGLEPKLHGGQQTNDFCYISDVARANKLALEATWDKYNQIYNIGTGVELTAEEAGQAVCDVMGYKGKIEVIEPRTVDPGRFCFNVDKAKEMLGFEAEYTFAKGLKDMYENTN